MSEVLLLCPRHPTMYRSCTFLPTASFPQRQDVCRKGRTRGLAATGSAEGVRIFGVELGRAYV